MSTARRGFNTFDDVIAACEVTYPMVCWQWTGTVNKGGYGQTYLKGIYERLVHRIVFIHLKGNIPEGYELHHWCGNKLCCRPDHMRLVTVQEHQRISAQHQNDRKTHCAKGHPYTPENTGVSSQSWRFCRICHRARSLAHYRKKKG